jgi:hypothetical protein
MSRPRPTSQQKNAVAVRAGFCCEYCWSQLRFSPDPFSVEHIIPRVAGGTDELDNLALSCQGCNGFKHVSTVAVDPGTGREVLLFNPRQHHWGEHFAWSDDYAHILGLTPIGRATVEKLQLNREGVVALRCVLFALGQHPPSG